MLKKCEMPGQNSKVRASLRGAAGHSTAAVRSGAAARAAAASRTSASTACPTCPKHTGHGLHGWDLGVSKFRLHVASYLGLGLHGTLRGSCENEGQPEPNPSYSIPCRPCTRQGAHFAGVGDSRGQGQQQRGTRACGWQVRAHSSARDRVSLDRGTLAEQASGLPTCMMAATNTQKMSVRGETPRWGRTRRTRGRRPGGRLRTRGSAPAGGTSEGELARAPRRQGCSRSRWRARAWSAAPAPHAEDADQSAHSVLATQAS